MVEDIIRVIIWTRVLGSGGRRVGEIICGEGGEL